MLLLKIIAVTAIALFSILVLILGNRLHNFMAELHPPVNYLKNSEPSSDPWRWRKPKLEEIHYQAEGRLKIQDQPAVSCFIFPQRTSIAEVTLHIFGMFLVGSELFRLLGVLLKGSIANFAYFLPEFLFWGGLGLILLQVGDRVLQINLYPGHLEVVTLHTLALRRKIRHAYPRHALIHVKGQVQSFWTMERGQIYPDYKITLGRSRFGGFQVNQTFSLTCNQTQGAWVVGGLNHWKSLPIGAD